MTSLMVSVSALLQAAFTHLAFSGAFALFTFAEYVRYFALYPFGAAVHLFMNEFLDSKDGGTAILSHFYLLTGCANSIWFEGYVSCLCSRSLPARFKVRCCRPSLHSSCYDMVPPSSLPLP